MRGYVGNAAGDTLRDFNGIVAPKVFDKRAVVTTLDNDASEGPFTYEVFQSILHKGLATVEEGAFEFSFVVPRDIDFSFGTGRISACTRSGDVDAHGFSEDFVIRGTATNPVQDDEGPVVELLSMIRCSKREMWFMKTLGCSPGCSTRAASTPRATESAMT